MFPIPVITGIGHATNETVVELIAHKNAITPTELADFLLQKFHDFSVPVQKAEERLIERARRILKDEGLNFQNTVRYFRSITDNILIRSHHEVQQEAKELFQRSARFLIHSKEYQSDTVYKLRTGTLTFCNARKQEIKHCVFSFRKDINASLKQKDADILNLTRSVANMQPENVLKRGYSITMFKGKAVTEVGQLKENDMLETRFAGGSISSEVKRIQKKNSQQ
jgi:exodeoxyribonuclease VII large subunit